MIREYKIYNEEANTNLLTISSLWLGFDHTVESYNFYKKSSTIKNNVKDSFIFWQNDVFKVWFKEKQVKAANKEIIDKIGKDKQFYKKTCLPTLREGKKAQKLFYKINESNLSKIDNYQLIKWIKELFLINVITTDFGATVVLGDLDSLLSDKLEKIIVQKIDPRMPKRSVQEYLNILISQNIYTYSQEEKLRLQKSKGQKLVSGAGKVFKKDPWLNYEYQGPKMTIEGLINSVKEQKLFPLSEIKEKQKKFVEELKLDKKELNYFFHAQHYVFQKAYRMDIRSMVDYAIDLILKEISKRTVYTLAHLRYCLPEEIEKILNGGKINKKELESRRKYCLVYFDKEGKLEFLFDKKKIEKYIKEREIKEKFDKNIKELKGVVAQLGKVRGKVKIIASAEDMNKMTKGDILVAYNTTPDLLPAMKKAGAIVTNMGGITCHAAIVSRELGIPCIIGTKIATKILKDGDLVEVDATKGVVKILKKK